MARGNGYIQKVIDISILRNPGPEMITKRLRAMSVSVDARSWWVTGGVGDSGILNTTEIYRDGSFSEGVWPVFLK